MPISRRNALQGSRIGILAIGLALVAGTAAAQTVRNYNAQFTTTPPTIDGVVSPGEWDGADPAAGDWRELRQLETDVDTDNNRFRVLWDANALYILYETDFANFLPPQSIANPVIAFGDENINLYLDPNTDDEPNFVTNPDTVVDKYQLSFNQYEGSLLSTNADRDGVGFFTEASVNSRFGDQGNWNGGVAGNSGPALGTIRVAHMNTNFGANAGGISEIEIPWENFDADAEISDGMGGAIQTGLFHPMAPNNGDQWFFNVAMINMSNPSNFLPIWNWHSGDVFASHPSGTITYVPEPNVTLTALSALAGLALLTRRRWSPMSR